MSKELGERLVALLPRLRRFAIGLCRSADVADDLVQSACERALSSGEAGSATSLKALMLRIIRNLWYDRLRRKRTRGTEVGVDDTLDLVAFHGDAATTERRMMLERVSAAMAELPDEQRELLLLVCVEELSYREAAEVLDIPIGTVMSRLARARRRLAEETGLARSDL